MRKLAIIGVGRHGKKLVAEFSKISDVVAYNSLREQSENVDWMTGNYPDIERRSRDGIFEDKSIDGVIISVPIRTVEHDLLVMAMKHDKHVFLEKPGFSALSFMTAERQKKVVFVGYKFLYDPSSVGYVERLHFTWKKFGTFDSGITENLACHDIATAISIFGRSVDIDVTQKSKHTLRFSILFENDRVATFDIDRMNHVNMHVMTDQTYRAWHFDSDKSLTAECAAFIDCMNGEAEPLATELILDETFKVMAYVRSR